MRCFRIDHACLISLLAITATVTGCHGKVASKLAGRWDLVATEKIVDEAGNQKDDSSGRAVDDTESLFNSMSNGESSGTMTLVFHRNGKLETFTDFPMASTGKPKTGLWSTVSWNDNTRVAIIRCDLNDEVTETRVTFIDDDTIQLIPPNIAVLEMELRFRRSR